MKKEIKSNIQKENRLKNKNSIKDIKNYLTRVCNYYYLNTLFFF